MSGQWLDFLLGQCEAVRGDDTPIRRSGGTGGEAPRVLVEDPDGASTWAVTRTLTAAGYEVATCPGPEQLRAGCPLLGSGACSFADDAAAVVFALPLSNEISRRVLTAHRERRAAATLCVRVDGLEGSRYAPLLAGCKVVHVASSPASFTKAVGDAARTP